MGEEGKGEEKVKGGERDLAPEKNPGAATATYALATE